MDVLSWDTQLNVESGRMLGTVSPEQVSSTLNSEVAVRQVKEYFREVARGKKRKREKEKGIFRNCK